MIGGRSLSRKEDSYVPFTAEGERTFSSPWSWSFHSLSRYSSPKDQTASLFSGFLAFSWSLLWMQTPPQARLSEPFFTYLVTENSLQIASGCFSSTSGPKTSLKRNMKRKKTNCFLLYEYNQDFFPRTGFSQNSESHGCRDHEWG